jgi:hypothetical protein
VAKVDDVLGWQAIVQAHKELVPPQNNSALAVADFEIIFVDLGIPQVFSCTMQIFLYKLGFSLKA